MKLFNIFKRHTENVEQIDSNGMERFDGNVVENDDEELKYHDGMSKL